MGARERGELDRAGLETILVLQINAWQRFFGEEMADAQDCGISSSLKSFYFLHVGSSFVCNIIKTWKQLKGSPSSG